MNFTNNAEAEATTAIGSRRAVPVEPSRTQEEKERVTSRRQRSNPIMVTGSHTFEAKAAEGPPDDDWYSKITQLDSTITPTKAKGCGHPSCKFCYKITRSTLMTSGKFRSQFGKQTFKTKAMQGQEMGCKTRNVVYLITCKTCGLQYVGRTIQELQHRACQHRENSKKFPTNSKGKVPDTYQKSKGTTYANPHFQNCGPMQFDIIEAWTEEEIFKHPEIFKHTKEQDTPSERMESFLNQRESLWVIRLKTQYPYGLNDKLSFVPAKGTVWETLQLGNKRSNEYKQNKNKRRKESKKRKKLNKKNTDTDSDNTNTHDNKRKRGEEINSSGRNSSGRIIHEDKQEDNDDNKQEAKEDVKEVWDEGTCMDQLKLNMGQLNWAAKATQVIHQLKSTQLKRILYQIYMEKKKEKFRQLLDLTEDMVRWKLKLTNFKKETVQRSKWMVKVMFVNDGFNDIRLESILHDKTITKLLPDIVAEEVPNVVYKYTQPIRNEILNYSQVTRNNANKKLEEIPCSCHNHPKYISTHWGHVCTGDLEIIQNQELREIIKKGPAYRLKQQRDIKAIKDAVAEGLDALIAEWTTTYQNDPNVIQQNLHYWKDAVLKKVEQNYNAKYTDKYSKKPNDEHIQNEPSETIPQEALKKLQEDHVLVCADKSANNVIVVCQRFYIERLREEMSPSRPSEAEEKNEHPPQQRTYKKVERTQKQVIEEVTKTLLELGFPPVKVEQHLAEMYWTAKMHKDPIAQRFIAASNKCVTRQLSKTIGKCLKEIQKTLKEKDDYLFKKEKVRRFWIVENTQDVLNRVEGINFKTAAKGLDSFDFSTLYTMIDHDSLFQEIQDVLEEAFIATGKTYLLANTRCAIWSDKESKTKEMHSLTKENLMKLIKVLVTNIFVVCGNDVYRQEKGIPMGTDCAPFLANLYLYARESKWIDGLRQSKVQKDKELATKMKDTSRYLDDLLAINDGGTMTEKWGKIYPESLKLKKENKESHKTHFLDLQLVINNNTIVTSVYDKRDDFPFHVVTFPNLSGNLHFRRTHGIIIGQLLRYAKNCQDREIFAQRTKTLTETLQKQHFDRKLLAHYCQKFFEERPDFKFKYNLRTQEDIHKVCFNATKEPKPTKQEKPMG
jgi:hypothetical protein